MRHVRTAGVASTFPEGSIARTRTVCRPNARPEYVFGDVQNVHGPFICLHSNFEPACEELNLNVAVRAVVGLRGPAVIVAFGFESSGVIPSRCPTC